MRSNILAYGHGGPNLHHYQHLFAVSGHWCQIISKNIEAGREKYVLASSLHHSLDAWRNAQAACDNQIFPHSNFAGHLAGRLAGCLAGS